MDWLRSTFLTMAALPLAACMTWTRVPLDVISSRIERGDEVRVGIRGGREMRFEVKEVRPSALVGEGVWVSRDQIERLERGESTTLGKIGEVAVTVIAVSAVALAAVAIVKARPEERVSLLDALLSEG